MSHSTTMTIRLEPELKTRLGKLASVTHRSKSFLASEAVREYIELNEWQIQELKAAIKNIIGVKSLICDFQHVSLSSHYPAH